MAPALCWMAVPSGAGRWCLLARSSAVGGKRDELAPLLQSLLLSLSDSFGPPESKLMVNVIYLLFFPLTESCLLNKPKHCQVEGVGSSHGVRRCFSETRWVGCFRNTWHDLMAWWRVSASLCIPLGTSLPLSWPSWTSGM